MKRRNSQQLASPEKGMRVARKRLKSISDFWADTENEKKTLYIDCVSRFESPLNLYASRDQRYNMVRAYCISRELDKCVYSGTIESKDKIVAMLKADKEFSEMALNIVYKLRETRLGH